MCKIPRDMFLKQTSRLKDGKEHHYWSLVENRRVDGGRKVVLCLFYGHQCVSSILKPAFSAEAEQEGVEANTRTGVNEIDRVPPRFRRLDHNPVRRCFTHAPAIARKPHRGSSPMTPICCVRTSRVQAHDWQPSK